ncbi:MAG: pyridoxal-phosphate dependent enzyme [Acidobacteria bacterium]|nr:pyridoxal-phosphate dependent enzyme [Acidobacteriota bacterium]
MSIWRWADWIEPVPAAARITLGEGNTPVVRSRHIGPALGMNHLYFKLESCNPTGSYKDRFAAAAVSDMLAHGKRYCLATTSGNTGSALAAYCAAVGVSCKIATVETAPAGKLKQMMAYGADIFRIRGSGSDPRVMTETIQILKELSQRDDVGMQVSAYTFSPVGMSGVQSISYELVEQIDRPIDHVFVPAGGGGLTLAVARGFRILVEHKRISSSPAVHCVQPEGNDTMAGPLRDGLNEAHAVQCTSKISGLQVASVIDGNMVIPACRSVGGNGHVVSDEQVWALQERLVREEGVFCEPAGAVALVGAIEALREKLIEPDATIVCLVTGTGFKDETSVDRMLHGAQCPTINTSDIASRLREA